MTIPKLFISLSLCFVSLMVIASEKEHPFKKDFDQIKTLSKVDPQKANAKLDSLISLDPEKAETDEYIQYYKGYVNYFLDQPRIAILFLEKAIKNPKKLKPIEMAKAYISLSDAYAEMCKWKESVNTAQAGIDYLGEDGDKRFISVLYTSLGHTLCELKQFDKAMDAYNKALQLYRFMPKKSAVMLEASLKIRMARTYYLFQSKAEAGVNFLRPTIKNLESMDSTEIVRTFKTQDYFDSQLLIMYSTIVALYDKVGAPQKGEKEATKAMEYLERIPMPESAVYEDLIEHYIAINQLDKANKLIKDIHERYSDGTSVSTIAQVIARWNKMVAYSLKDYKKAYSFQTEEMNIKDSLVAQSNTEAALELAEIYQSFEKEKEIEKQKGKITTYKISTVLSIVILILLIIYITSRIGATKKIKERNRELYRQLQKSSDREKTLESLILKNYHQPENKTEEETSLFYRFTHLMLNDRLFLEPDVRIKEIANKIGTNEKYLSDAIKENTGTTFLIHINRLRVEYAKTQMSNNTSDNKIEAISLMSGFTSYRTFARVFKLETGLAPSEFYKMAQSTDIIEPQKLDEE